MRRSIIFALKQAAKNRPLTTYLIVVGIIGLVGVSVLKFSDLAATRLTAEVDNGAAVAPISPVAITADKAAPASGFVTRNGKDLMLDSKPYKFVGYNYFGLTGCADGRPDPQATVDRYFAGLRPASTTRTWAFKPQGMTGIDQVVSAAEKHGQKIIFALADGAQNCNDTGYNNSFYQSGYRGTYFDWIQQVVSKHKDSPAILAWEIMNEPCHIGTGGLSKDDMRNFFENTAAYIKANDPNHLVFTGSLAPYDCGGALSDFAYVHGGEHIDGGSLHEYDYLSVGQRGASSHWNNVRPALHGINKVAYVGEVGVGSEGGCLSDAEMASAHKAKLDGYMNAGASGVLVWGFDDDKVCGLYSGRQITFGTPTESMFRGYVIPDYTASAAPTAATTRLVSPAAPINSAKGSFDDTAFSYDGMWSVGNTAGKYQDNDQYSAVAGAYYTFRFTGTQAKIYGSMASHHGIAAISIDGGPETTVDLYRPGARAEQQLLFTSPKLSQGVHTVKVRVTGNHNAASTGVVISADRIDVQ